jgi:hypothetical protein
VRVQRLPFGTEFVDLLGHCSAVSDDLLEDGLRLDLNVIRLVMVAYPEVHFTVCVAGTRDRLDGNRRNDTGRTLVGEALVEEKAACGLMADVTET